jgi:hypothetical protein
MSAPYSYDLRKKAIEAVKRGERKTDVCRFLKISRNPLDLWLKREKSTGDCQASANSAKGRKPKIQDPEKFREFVREHSDKTQKQIAKLWGEELTQLPYQLGLSKARNYSKKKLMVIKREMKKNEQNSEKNSEK